MSRINVAHVRAEMGLTPAQFAEKLGVHERTVFRWEAHEVEPSPLAFRQMQAVIGRHRSQRASAAEATAPLTRGIPGAGDRS